MNKFYSATTIVFIFFFAGNVNSATWEKVYSKKNTDCFRNVREVPAGGFIAAGYTSDFTTNDSDAFVMRFDDNGDSLWSLKYNGPSSKEDCFYKVLPTADGGYVLCGYSKSFGNGENALYMKINSVGSIQWTNNWGGSGIERAQDIVELSDGSFVICGYTTSSPAQYYDAFILKIDQNGGSVWNKRFGTSAYDDANSIKILSDGGFLTGGQSNNDLYLIRTNSDGNLIWTKTFGTSGTDNIESVNFAQTGDGFILAGSTNGAGAGGDDGYIVKTDTGGVQVWAKTYGGSLNDDFHRIELTSDGGYIASGTSSTGAWANPNIWLNKIDVNGNSAWSKVFGGDHHDHGYGGQQTSDGGYLVGGHTRSYGGQEEDAIIIKTNSSGVVTNPASYTAVTNLISPIVTTCGSATAQIQVEIENFGIQTVTSVPVIIEITGAINQTLTQTYTGSIDWEQKKTMTFTATVNMAGGGTFNFHCYTGNQHDVYPPHNFFDKSITVGGTLPPTGTDGSHCGPGTVTISASSPTTVQWFAAATGGSALATGSSFTTPYLFSSTTYYAQSGGSCQSARVPVQATVAAGITPPTPTNGSRCGSGSVSLSASSAYTIKWYSSATSTVSLTTGTTYSTPSISSTTTYYLQADDASCSSTRTAIVATVNTPPSNPVTTSAARCNSGTVTLSATSGSSVEWYDAAVNGNLLHTGSSFTTPVLTTTTVYYASANNGTCSSGRVSATATISTPPPDAVTTSGSRCGSGTVTLSATSPFSIKWYDAASGGNQVGTGASFTTPSISSTTVYYAAADNGCMGNRIAATATVNALPSPPVTTTAERCGTGTVTLTATASNPVKWFDAATGGSQVGSGTSFTTPVISTTKTYYAASDNGCLSNRIAAVATINVVPAVPVATSVSRCGSGTVTLTATSSSSMEWYDAPVNGNLVDNGSSFTTPNLTSTTTYYVLANNGNCSSARVPVVATISSPPALPITSPGQRCGQGTVVLTAVSAAPIKWFDAPSGGTQVGTGTSFTTPSISVTTTFYAMADNGCISNRVPAIATVNPQPDEPVTTDAEHCGDTSLLLTATASDPIVWYDAATGGNNVGSGNNFNTPVISTTTTYYAASDDGQCESNRIPAVATIYAVPADPIATPANRCGNGTLVLSVTSTDSLKWYDAPSGNQIGSGNTYTTPFLTTTTTYYIQASNDHCDGNIIPVTAGVHPIATVDLGPDTLYCSSLPCPLDAGPGFSSYVWTTSATTQTYSPNSAGNYCVVVTDANGCSASDCIFVEFTVGIANEIQENSISVYPTPSHGMTTIEWQGKNNIQFSLFDMNGKRIFEKVIAKKETIDFSKLKPGVYVIRLNDEKTIAAKRLVIE